MLLLTVKSTITILTERLTHTNEHTNPKSHTHSYTHTHTFYQSHKEKEVFQGDPLIGRVIMIRLKIPKEKKVKLIERAVSGRVTLKERCLGVTPTLLNS